MGADGQMRYVRHLKGGHIGLARFRRGMPAGYGGFVPQHIAHDHPAGVAYKIGQQPPAAYLGRVRLDRRLDDTQARRKGPSTRGRASC